MKEKIKKYKGLTGKWAVSYLNALIFVLLPFIHIYAGNNSTSQVKNSGNTTYINIGISQPNVEDCYELSVPHKRMDQGWINIYPNPSPGQFTLELNHPSISLIIRIYDVTGKVVFQSREKPEGNHFLKVFDIGEFQKGVYFIHLRAKDRVGVKQIVIN